MVTATTAPATAAAATTTARSPLVRRAAFGVSVASLPRAPYIAYFGNNGNGNLGGGIYECTPDSGNWETTGAVTCSLVVLDQALNDQNDGLNCLPAMTGANPLAPFP